MPEAHRSQLGTGEVALAAQVEGWRVMEVEGKVDFELERSGSSWMEACFYPCPCPGDLCSQAEMHRHLPKQGLSKERMQVLETELVEAAA